MVVICAYDAGEWNGTATTGTICVCCVSRWLIIEQSTTQTEIVLQGGFGRKRDCSTFVDADSFVPYWHSGESALDRRILYPRCIVFFFLQQKRWVFKHLPLYEGTAYVYGLKTKPPISSLLRQCDHHLYRTLEQIPPSASKANSRRPTINGKRVPSRPAPAVPSHHSGHSKHFFPGNSKSRRPGTRLRPMAKCAQPCPLYARMDRPSVVFNGRVLGRRYPKEGHLCEHGHNPAPCDPARRCGQEPNSLCSVHEAHLLH